MGWFSKKVVYKYPPEYLELLELTERLKKFEEWEREWKLRYEVAEHARNDLEMSHRMMFSGPDKFISMMRDRRTIRGIEKKGDKLTEAEKELNEIEEAYNNTKKAVEETKELLVKKATSLGGTEYKEEPEYKEELERSKEEPTTIEEDMIACLTKG